MKHPIRSLIKAPPGYLLIESDLSQAETWIVAFLANEPSMKQELAGGDIHTLSARIIFEDESITKENEIQRYLGKKMNHSSSYRASPFMITIMINKESDKPPFVTVTTAQTKVYHKKWLAFFNLSIWWKEIEEQLQRNRTLITPYRRKREFYDIWGNELFKAATAFIPQSTIADHVYGQVQPELGIEGGLKGIKKNIIDKYSDIQIINTAHDSCVTLVPKDIAKDIAYEVKNQLQRPMMINGEVFTIPVDIKIGEVWGELEKVNL